MIILENNEKFNTLDNLSDNNSFKSLKTLFQNHYNAIVLSFNYSHITCDQCNCNDWSFHAYYFRYINFHGFKFKIRICRIICKSCHKTHAIFIAGIIPFISFNYLELKSALSGSYDYIEPADVVHYFYRLKQFETVSYKSFCEFFSRNLTLLFTTT